MFIWEGRYMYCMLRYTVRFYITHVHAYGIARMMATSWRIYFVCWIDSFFVFILLGQDWLCLFNEIEHNMAVVGLNSYFFLTKFFIIMLPLTYFSCNYLLLPLMFTPFATHVHIIFPLPALIASKTPQYLERFTISIRSLKLWNQLKIALCLNLRFIPSLSVQSAPVRTTLSPMSNLIATLTTLTISFFPMHYSLLPFLLIFFSLFYSINMFYWPWAIVTIENSKK